MVTDLKTSRKEASHERILEAAARALRQSGYAGVSVADVMKEAGLTHGGFYAHFDSRDAMIVEAIGYAGAQNTESMTRRMATLQKRGASPFRSLVDSYLSEQHMRAPHSGCVVAALGSEMPRQSDLVRRASYERVTALIRLVRSVLPAAVDDAQAALIVSTLVGALQTARALGGEQGKALLAASRAALLEQYEPDPAHGAMQ